MLSGVGDSNPLRSEQVLLLADFGAGHEMGSTRSQRDQEFADQLAFLYIKEAGGDG